MNRRKRHKLPDGRYFVQVSPSVFHLFDAFGAFVTELPAEVVSLDTSTEEVEVNANQTTGKSAP